MSNLSVTEYAIFSECSQFLDETGGIPLYKKIPSVTDDFRKIKIRFKKSRTYEYDKAIERKVRCDNFKNRCLNVYRQAEDNSFYIFVPNGYNVLTSTDNIRLNIEEVYSAIVNSSIDIEETIGDLLDFSLEINTLSKHISINDEFIFYNIPYYYCLRADVPYNEIIKKYEHFKV